MADQVELLLTKEEAAAMLLMIALGTDAYEGNIPNREIINRMDRLPPRHLKLLSQKLNDLATVLEME